MTYKTALIVTEALQSMNVLFVSMIHFARALSGLIESFGIPKVRRV